MKNVRETRTAQTDSVSTDPRLPQPWKPANDTEELLSIDLRANARAKSGSKVGRGPFSQEDETSFDVAQKEIKTIIQKVIELKEAARLGGENLLPGIGLVQDGVHAIVTAPSMNKFHTTMDILVPIEELDEEAQIALPPLSEEAVIKGIEDAERRVETAHFHWRKGDGEWEKVQEAIRDKLTRFAIVIRAKHDGNLTAIELNLSEDGEKAVLTLPPRASRTEPLSVEATIKDLESLNPGVRSLLG